MTDVAAIAADPKKKKKSGGLKRIGLALAGVAVLAGGGAAAGIYASSSGLIGGGKPAAHEDPNRPKLVHREEGTAGQPGKTSAYQTSYYEIDKSFTANLLDTDGFMQASIGVATNYDERVLENVKKHELPIRSAVLLTLSDQEAEVISTPAGKAQLLKALKVAINKVLVEKEGFGGISDVYFTSFVIQ